MITNICPTINSLFSAQKHGYNIDIGIWLENIIERVGIYSEELLPKSISQNLGEFGTEFHTEIAISRTEKQIL